MFLWCFYAATTVYGQSSVRYDAEVFSSCEVKSNILYGHPLSHEDSTKNLLLDVYLPTGDTSTSRPLLVFVHGGGFKNNDKVGAFNARFCSGFAKRGYVAASVNYRLTKIITTHEEYFYAVMRAVQDVKAAIRFFRKNAARYGIDTSKIVVAGSSAGAVTALHLAYMQESMIPSFVDKHRSGSLEGDRGNEGYSSGVHAVVNCWGALTDSEWLKGSTISLYSIHGTEDTTVYFSKIPSYRIFRYGSASLNDAANRYGIPHGLRIFYNTGHTLDNNALKQDSAIASAAHWLSKNFKMEKQE